MPRPSSPHADPIPDDSSVAFTIVQDARDDAKTPATDPLNKQAPDALPSVPFTALYRFATPTDKLCLVVATLSAGASGALFPCMALVFGHAIASFQRGDGGVDTHRVNTAALEYLGLAGVLFVLEVVSYTLFTMTAEGQMKRLRAAAARHLLYMDMAWFDAHDALQLSTRLTGDTVKIQDGMGKKLGDAVKYFCQFVGGYAIGLAQGWDTTLVMASVMPLMAASLAWLLLTVRKSTTRTQTLVAEGGAIAEETLGAIRTVASLNAEQRAIAAYDAHSRAVEALHINTIRTASIVIGLFSASTWFMYAVGLWYGGWRVAHDKATPTAIFQGFFGVLLGTLAVGQVAPSATAIAEARGAAAGIYQILDTQSAIDASRDDGVVPTKCSGQIEVVDVHFEYPSRPHAPVFNGYSVMIDAGRTIAFVGASGGGKSTLVALLERFYDPSSGQILLDGRDIRSLNLQWLRAQIGVVSQEPVLFAQTIRANIAAGSANVTRDDVVRAATLAHAHDFIMALPQQYETLVGDKGVALSGGQKQRVALARALVRKPSILVLDEATSALDTESERAVQADLDALMAETSMTMLVIAHRLSTVRRADKIVVLSGGRVVEQGTHAELMAMSGGEYQSLYTLQEGNEVSHQGPMDLVASRTDRASLKIHHDDKLTEMKQDEEVRLPSFTLGDAMTLSRPERKVFVLGSIASAVSGFAMPIAALLISQLLATMIQRYGAYEASGDTSILHTISRDVRRYCLVYIGGAFVLWVLKTVAWFCFRFMGQKLTTRVRHLQFSALCRQNIAFFDIPKHGPGALTSDLATLATKLSDVSGDTLGRVVESVFTFVAALAVSFSLGSWRLTLVMLVVFPLLIASEALRFKQLRTTTSVSEELADVGACASEALTSMRTVASLGLESRLCDKLEQLLERPVQRGRRDARVNGVASGFSTAIVFVAYALVFWYGGRLVDWRDITFLEMMRTLMAVMLSAQGVGVAASFVGDSKDALAAGAALTALCERPLPIDAFDESGERPTAVRGDIAFEDVTFRYPSRPRAPALERFSLTIHAGQTVAFCGPSGSGKSTTIALLERFYDPDHGVIRLDGRDLRTLNVQWLRRQLALVSQEPTLFLGSISDNIAFGLEPRPTDAAIEAAAKMANAHDFITQFPDGYATPVGLNGTQLSGGQKQRIAIARAVVRDPSVLLLDEATSALDAASERVVQAALDHVVATRKRTTIMIAHRLSTIRNADVICVVHGGRIAEKGTHDALVALRGVYAKLVQSAAT